MNSSGPVPDPEQTKRRPRSAFYRAVARALDKRIRSLRLTMAACDDASGLQDGYTAKILHPDSPGGRQPSWYVLQLLVDALYPSGCRVLIQALDGDMLAQASMTDLPTPARAAMYVPTPQKAREMAAKRAEKLTPQQRRRIARRAAYARWRG